MAKRKQREPIKEGVTKAITHRIRGYDDGVLEKVILMKKYVYLLLIPAAALCLGAGVSASEKAPEEYEGTLTVYSSHDQDPLNAGVAAFEEAYPNVKVEVVAGGTSDLAERIAAEAGSPAADVLWGGGADTLAACKEYFQPYKPSCMDQLDPTLCDPGYCWVGESPLPMVFIANTDLLPEDAVPESWADLAGWDADAWGRIAIADPVSSGSAFTQLCTILFLFGEEGDGYAAGWDFVSGILDKLEVKSSSAMAHEDVRAGKNALGITFEKAAVQYEEDFMKVIYPSDGTSAVPDGVAIIKDCPHPELAELFEEFVLSADCQRAQNTDWGRRPIRGDVEPAGLPALSDVPLMDYNFEYAALNADAIKETWSGMLDG